ncbi:hypothetical protein OS493_002490 [Desmophyllum pertusum]|uniref:Ig-like domain-containing protein n=1 Tax=Desmophyllum pertusum TaxID=174260 RepID=A0A9X0CP23_9CNID|nr:hypothetical protein OS493_002490 [Desmophyllum pertusum]
MTIGDNVTALTNTSITIQCPTSGVPTPTVKWTINGREIHNDGRYRINIEGSLVIDGAVQGDTARYTCTAHSVAGQDSASSMVRIVYPIKPVIDVPKTGREIPVGDGSPVTMNVGDNVTAASNSTITMRCPVSGVPTPAVTWHKDGVQVLEGDKLSIMDDNTLIIKGPEVEDSAKYTCSVQNSFGKDDASSTVRIIEPHKPVVKLSDKPETIEAQDRSPITLTIGDNVTALTNTFITIRCHASGVPTPTVTWTKDGQDIPNLGRYIVQDDGSLLIIGADSEDTARYTCTADSVVGQDSASSSVKIVGKILHLFSFDNLVKLLTSYGVLAKMFAHSLQFLELQRQLTDKKYLSSYIDPVKPMIQVPESGRETPIGDGRRNAPSVASANQLLLNIMFCVTRFEIIICFMHTEPVKPIIQVPEPGQEIPVGDGSPVTMNVGDNVTAASNTTITIRCPVSGVPTPAVTWQKDGVPLFAGEKIYITNDKMLVIRVAKGEDSGKYTCSVKNKFGMDSVSSVVSILGKLVED